MNSVESLPRPRLPGSITTQSLVIITSQSLVSFTIQERSGGTKVSAEEADFQRISYLSPTIQWQNDLACLIGSRGAGLTAGVSQLVINGLYPTFIPPLLSSSPPSLTNCLTFQCELGCRGQDQSHSDVQMFRCSLRCELVSGERKQSLDQELVKSEI